MSKVTYYKISGYIWPIWKCEDGKFTFYTKYDGRWKTWPEVFYESTIDYPMVGNLEDYEISYAEAFAEII